MSVATQFLSRTETPVPIIHPPGSGKSIGVLGARSVFKTLPSETGGAYAILEQEVLPGGGPPLHVHRHETEIFYILEGEFELTVGSRKVAAPASTIAVCPRDIPHTFRNVGPSTGRLLLTVIPGHFANYFLDVDGLPEHDRASVRTLAARYDVEILE